MLVKTYGCTLIGVDALTITIEVNTDKGYKFFLVGLPDNAIKESQRRIEAALKNIGLKMPGKRITVNLAPADLRKEGSAFDLAIATGILAAAGYIESSNMSDYVMMGELSLDGGLQPLKGALSMAMRARKDGFKGIILPEENVAEASLVEGIEILGFKGLGDVINFLEGRISSDELARKVSSIKKKDIRSRSDIDFEDVKGQQNIKRAFEIAAAGNHNLILIGPPGAGKTMLARRVPTILPELSVEEAIETTRVHSVAGLTHKNASIILNRPFRNPHHTISDVALVGGGGSPQPGEISLAHNGVLFLDELPEFKRSVLEVLRQPLEERKIHVSRARMAVEFPANFMLIASMNPCPCGNYTHPEKECICSPVTVQRYLHKISGPLMDRIDMHVQVTPIPFKDLAKESQEECSEDILSRVMEARNIQKQRLNNEAYITNSELRGKALHRFCRLNNEGQNLLKKAVETLSLSARAYDRILRISRTIADLDRCQDIHNQHLAEAIQYRSLDRQKWSR